jgi:beta-phosphoglucomutase-like phosphatase (HAD superfamily)
MVATAKPNPDIYQKAPSDLSLQAQDCMAIEDTVASMGSALAAGITCIAFPGVFADALDFNGAVLVTDKLSPNHLMP